jgi:hypothetical protein
MGDVSEKNFIIPKLGSHEYFKISVIIFIILSTILFSYLYLARYENQNEIIFWFLIIGLMSTIFLQGILSKFNGNEVYILLFELLILNILLHGIFQFPFYLNYGTDSHYETNIATSVINSGHIQFNTDLSLWPILHILAASSSYLTNIDILTLTKYMGILIDFSVPILLFVFFKLLIFNEKQKSQISFLAVLVYITITNHIEFNATFIKETMALPIMIMILYFYYKRFQNSNIWLSVILIILVAEIAFTHHFSSFMIILILLTIMIYGFITDKIYESKFSFKSKFIFNIKFKNVPVKNNLILYTIVVILAYWVFIALLPVTTFSFFISNLIHPSIPTYSDMANITVGQFATLKGYIVFYGFFIFNGIFASILLIKYNSIKRIYPFVLVLFICGIIGFVGTFIASVYINPDRLITYGWLFGTLPLLLAIFKINNFKIKKICMLLIFLFLLFNVFQISSSYYTESSNIFLQPTPQDYVGIEKINMSNGNILSYQNDKMAVIDIYGNINGTSLFPTKDVKTDVKMANNNYYNYIIINKFYVNSLNYENKNIYNYYTEYLKYINDLNNFTNYQKVSDSNKLSVYIKYG